MLQPKGKSHPDAAYDRHVAEQLQYVDMESHIRLAEQGNCASFRWLLNLYREQLCEGKRGHVQLGIFFSRASRQIWESADPVAKLRALIGGHKRGPKFKNADRHREIALLLEARRKGALSVLQGRRGQTFEQACEEVAELENLSFDHVEKIYKSFSRRELKAEIALRHEREWIDPSKQGG